MRLQVNAACNGYNAMSVMAVVQFGLAMMPLCHFTSEALISGTTSGTLLSMRKALELSTTTAPEAAGVIHTDFQKGFIRAEVISYDDFIKYNGEQGAKDAGRWRLEGKEYVIQDGDVVHFRFNV